MQRPYRRTIVYLSASVLVAGTALVLDRVFPDAWRLPGRLSALALIGVIAGIAGICALFVLLTHLLLAYRVKPAVEGVMLARLYWLAGALAAVLSVAYGMGVLASFGAAFSLFGGMLLGWSLQAPVSGFAAWILVSLKRPFRPGDRVQFPGLGLTGDIMDIGPMYTVLDQVGGSIASEEAVGRHILVPNAMLFSQVVINYTVTQEAAFMLDEVVVRITYDSNWTVAEEILLKAANTVTHDIVQATGAKPYVRADLYDYGVYLRLRYHTGVQDRVETSYKISKLIFEEIQRTPAVDIAIPFVYSYRAGQDRKTDESLRDRDAGNLIDIDVSHVTNTRMPMDAQDVEQLAIGIKANGLMQPIVVTRRADESGYEILAGHLRFEACKRLGWAKVPAIVRTLGNGDANPPAPRPKASAGG